MRPLLAFTLSILLAAPLAVADPKDGTPGIPNACEKSPPGEPCKFIKAPPRVIPEDRVVSGDNRVYTGDWTQVGTLTVEGTVTFDAATVLQTNTSGGVVLKAGGTLILDTSTFTDGGDSPFKITAEASSTLSITGSSIVGGDGVVVATSAVTLTTSRLQDVAGTALALTNVTATVSDNTFANNQRAVYQTGGMPTLQGNTFENNYECVVDFRTDPTIIGNTFLHCIIGIWHEESHSTIKDNYFLEDAEPPSSGITVLGGMSPVIENNVIDHFVNGIVIDSGRAYIRNNTIRNNSDAGIVIVNNAAEMDIQGNDIYGNGGHGISLTGAVNIPVFNNRVHDNGGTGILVSGAATNVPLTGNVVENNGQSGIRVGAGVALQDNVATGNALHGIHVTSADGASLQGDAANGNGGTGVLVANSMGVSLLRVTANSNARGIALETSAGSIHNSNASGNANVGYHVDSGTLLAGSNMDCSIAMGNGQYGVVNFAGLETATHGWYQGNALAGVRTNDVDSVVDATNSYWGSPSGPTALTNPTGTGDRAEGQVVFTPFATSPAGTGCPAG